MAFTKVAGAAGCKYAMDADGDAGGACGRALRFDAHLCAPLTLPRSSSLAEVDGARRRRRRSSSSSSSPSMSSRPNARARRRRVRRLWRRRRAARARADRGAWSERSRAPRPSSSRSPRRLRASRRWRRRSSPPSISSAGVRSAPTRSRDDRYAPNTWRCRKRSFSRRAYENAKRANKMPHGCPASRCCTRHATRFNPFRTEQVPWPQRFTDSFIRPRSRRVRPRRRPRLAMANQAADDRDQPRAAEPSTARISVHLQPASVRTPVPVTSLARGVSMTCRRRWSTPGPHRHPSRCAALVLGRCSAEVSTSAVQRILWRFGVTVLLQRGDQGRESLDVALAQLACLRQPLTSAASSRA